MKILLLQIALIYAFALQISYQQTTFKPAKQTTGPFGVASGTAFNMGTDSFNLLPSRVIASIGTSGINSLSFAYMQQIGESVKTGGKQGVAITEAQMGKIVKAEVCTGIKSGATVIIGLKFNNENGNVNYFHGDTTQVTSFKCVDATPKTAGYYLQSLSGRYGTYINQLSFNWVSNFEQERACFNNANCKTALNFCPSDYCCYQKSKTPDGQWVNSVMCA